MPQDEAAGDRKEGASDTECGSALKNRGEINPDRLEPVARLEPTGERRKARAEARRGQEGGSSRPPHVALASCQGRERRSVA
jgi:hypothetical protein